MAGEWCGELEGDLLCRDEKGLFFTLPLLVRRWKWAWLEVMLAEELPEGSRLSYVSRGGVVLRKS